MRGDNLMARRQGPQLPSLIYDKASRPIML